MDPATIGLLASGLGNLAGNYFSGKSAEDAADAQRQQAERALALQNKIYEETKSNAEPFLTAGREGLAGYQGAIEGYTQPTFGYVQKDFNKDLTLDPGYQFRLDQAKKAIEASTAAKGMSLGSGVLKSLQTRGQDMASQEYQNAYDRWLKESNLKYGQASDQYNRDIGFKNQNIANLGNLTNLGTGALNTMAGVGSNYAQNAAQSMGNIGDAQAMGNIAQGNMWSNQSNLLGAGMSDFLKNYYATEGSKNTKTLTGSTGSTDAASSSNTNYA